jgi:hypothetical protein
MDLMNLTDELKYGKILQSGKSLVIMTPLARLDFCELVQPTQFQDTGPYRYGLDMIFERDPSKPAAVDVEKYLIPTLFEFAKNQGITPRKIVDGDRAGYILGGDKLAIRIGQRISAAGEPYAGYETSSVSIHASSRPKVQSPPWKGVPCVSPAGEAGFDPTAVYNGCYGRVIINPYKPKKWNIIAIGLQGVQMIADGEPLGGEGAGAAAVNAFGAVEGAEVKSNFENAMNDPSVDGDFKEFVGN